MPSFIILWKWTEQGIRNIRDAPTRIAAARAAAENLGGKLTVFYTMGDYDTVGIAEFPSDEANASFLISLGRLGNVRSTSLRAFTEPEGAALIARAAGQ